MKSFRTESGKTYTLELTIGKCRRITSELGLDLLSNDPTEFIDMLITKPLMRMDLMYLMLKDECDKDEFESCLTGLVAMEAERAMEQEIIFFIQNLSPERAATAQRLYEKGREVLARQVEMVDELFNSEEYTEAEEKARMEALDKAKEHLSKVSIERVEHSESIQARTR